MPISVRIEGLDELKAKLDGFPKIAIPYVNTAIKNSIYLILRQMTPKIPVNTGRLARSFPMGISFSALYGEMGSNVEYASSVHNMYSTGTPYHNPSKNKSAVAGFMNVGISESESEINKLFTEALDNIVQNLAQ
jgi:hypothetical protein